ncbi:hypothetical protein M9H77_31268 [Catharanthus roseus]|uniref:Uncharacterized protein n=1 Tax=Catharanthus roseus TaxID=4058 RepID=A0ACC0A0I9_CATRO|nr:hypothetical protein M9H77_31268 [Catharanthus roseus]
MFQTLDLLDLLFELEKGQKFLLSSFLKDIDVNLFLDLQEFNTFNRASFWRTLVNFEWLLNSPLRSFLSLNFFVYSSFSYHGLFKEICYLWNSYGVEPLVNKPDALFAYPLLRMDLRMNPFKGGADGMTQDAQETVELCKIQSQKPRLGERRRKPKKQV